MLQWILFNPYFLGCTLLAGQSLRDVRKRLCSANLPFSAQLLASNCNLRLWNCWVPWSLLTLLSLRMISARLSLAFAVMFLNVTETKKRKRWFLMSCSSEFRQFTLVTENWGHVCFLATAPSSITLIPQQWIWHIGSNQCWDDFDWGDDYRYFS